MDVNIKAILVIILLGFIVYSNSLFNAFVFDDLGLIVQNSTIHSLSRLPAVFLNQNLSQLTSSYYRPISQAIYTVIYAISHANPFGYHLIQLIFHITNSILLYYLFKKFFSPGLSLIASIIFLVHPINQFTVAYISSLHDPLYMFFGLLSLLLLSSLPSGKRYGFLMGLLILLSLLSKESGIQFMAIGIVYLFLYQKLKLAKYSGVFVTSGLIYACLRLATHTPIIKNPLVPIMALPLVGRLINIPEIILYYFGTYFYPVNLVAFHSWVITVPSLANFIFPLAFDLAAIILMFFFVTKLRGPEKKTGIFFLIWFFIGLSLHLQIFPIDMTVSDHFFYFAQVGLLGLLMLLFSKVRFSITIPSVILIAGLSLITFTRNFDWQNQSRLLAHDRAISRPDYLLELLYAGDLLSRTQYPDAMSHIRTAIRLYPESGRAYNVLGGILYQQNQIENARQAYLKSISLNQYYAAYENLGLLMTKVDSASAAAAFLNQATRVMPNSSKLWFYRIIAENKLGNSDQALISAANYYKLNPGFAGLTIYNRLLNKQPLNIDLK